METFPIVKRKDEERFGEYQTKRVILEIYDEMEQAKQSGRPYQTRLESSPRRPPRRPPGWGADGRDSSGESIVRAILTTSEAKQRYRAYIGNSVPGICITFGYYPEYCDIRTADISVTTLPDLGQVVEQH